MAGERRAKGTIAKYKAQADAAPLDLKRRKDMYRTRWVSRDKIAGRNMRTDLDPLDVLLALCAAHGGSIQIASVDPSIRDAGWCLATFDGDSLRLDRAGVCSIPESRRSPGLMSVSEMVGEVFEHIKAAHVIVFEHPVIYPTARAENPNHLMPLVAVLGGLVCAKDWLFQLAYTPMEWKGDLPKDVHQRRHLRDFPDAWVKDNLPDHNAADAALLMSWFGKEELMLPLSWSEGA